MALAWKVVEHHKRRYLSDQQHHGRLGMLELLPDETLMELMTRTNGLLWSARAPGRSLIAAAPAAGAIGLKQLKAEGMYTLLAMLDAFRFTFGVSHRALSFQSVRDLTVAGAQPLVSGIEAERLTLQSRKTGYNHTLEMIFAFRDWDLEHCYMLCTTILQHDEHSHRRRAFSAVVFKNTRLDGATARDLVALNELKKDASGASRSG
jgi:hypothetical protein